MLTTNKATSIWCFDDVNIFVNIWHRFRFYTDPMENSSPMRTVDIIVHTKSVQTDHQGAELPHD